MKTFNIYKIGISILLLSLIGSCGALKNRSATQTVPIVVTIQTEDPELTSVNLDVYALKVVDRLEDFNVVDLDLVDEIDTGGITLNISIENFNANPPDQRVARRVFRRAIQTGTNAAGRPVYQTVTASADIVTNRIRTSALFNTSFSIKGNPGKTFKKTFSDNLNIDNVYVTNIQGDSRALDPSIYSATMPPLEPLTDDILLALSNREMLDRLSREIRAYYDK